MNVPPECSYWRKFVGAHDHEEFDEDQKPLLFMACLIPGKFLVPLVWGLGLYLGSCFLSGTMTCWLYTLLHQWHCVTLLDQWHCMILLGHWHCVILLDHWHCVTLLGHWIENSCFEILKISAGKVQNSKASPGWIFSKDCF